MKFTEYKDTNSICHKLLMSKFLQRKLPLSDLKFIIYAFEDLWLAQQHSQVFASLIQEQLDIIWHDGVN